MVHILPTPTVDLYLFVPGPIGTGSWAWVEHPDWPGPLASEYVYNAREAGRVVRVYATALAHMLRTRDAERFNVTARGRTTGLIVAQDEWCWNNPVHHFMPCTDEPWNQWRQVARRYYDITGTRIESRRFRARVD